MKKEIRVNQNKTSQKRYSKKKSETVRLKNKENLKNSLKHFSNDKVLKNSPSKIDNKNEKLKKEKWITKTNVTYFILFLLDVILVIYSARQNIVNYVTVSGEAIFVSKTKYLLWGRNYINLIIIFFFYFYTCLINHFFLKNRNTKKFMGWLFVVLVLLNVILFFIFTKRIY